MEKENPVFRSLAVIEERIQEKLTVQKLADSVHFSKYHYQRMFREAVGDSVMAYVTRRRIALAAGELTETNASILEIALKYGYDSHEGFTRSFKSYMGITPTEYRKYYLSLSFPKLQKERCAMIYSKTTDEIIKELNGLIVLAKETAAYTKRSIEIKSEAAVFYFRFWNCIADRTNAMADELTNKLDCITDIAQCPDGISARFLILKAIEDSAFQFGVTAFQAGLMMARAKPEHRTEFLKICGEYEALARSARMSAGKIAGFFNELSALIFQDMRKNAERRIQMAVEKGKAAVSELSENPALPYSYITEEIKAVTDGLISMPLEEVTVSCLENALFRLDIIVFAADVEVLRVPSYKLHFDSIMAFREKIREAAEFFQGLPAEIAHRSAECEAGQGDVTGYTGDGKYSGIAFEGNVLLFWLKGEIQKLDNAHLNEEQKAALHVICNKMASAIRPEEQSSNGSIYGSENETADKENGGITEILQEVYDELTVQAEKLGMYGGPMQYIAEELKQLINQYR